MNRQTVFDYIKKKYKVLPEYPWRKNSGAVLRHADNKKWFALVMDVQSDKVGLTGTDYVDVINLKVDDIFFRDLIIQENGITMLYRGHPNKYIFLDGRQYWVMRNDENDPTTILNRCNCEEYNYSISWKGRNQ